MPIYEYQCPSCGIFERSVSMARCSEPSECPDCRLASSRVLSAVRGAQLSAAEVRARDRNLRSRHEPRVVSKEARKPRNPEERPKLQRSHGSRPWALEHG